ncbi:MAG: hypothetical protein KIS91_07380 [Anaerolineae bacterium]|nr:hypothetical protein [Anaerolineae bacterium]
MPPTTWPPAARPRPAPAVGHYRGLTVQSDPYPTAARLIQMLHAAEHFDLVSLGHNSPRIDLVARTMQWAFADWTTRLGDPLFTVIRPPLPTTSTPPPPPPASPQASGSIPPLATGRAQGHHPHYHRRPGRATASA